MNTNPVWRESLEIFFGEGQGFGQSPHLARHDATRRSGLSATERCRGRRCAFDIAAPHRLRIPPSLDIRSP